MMMPGRTTLLNGKYAPFRNVVEGCSVLGLSELDLIRRTAVPTRREALATLARRKGVTELYLLCDTFIFQKKSKKKMLLAHQPNSSLSHLL